MPCDSIQLNSIDVPAMNSALLKKALESLKATGIVITESGAAFYLAGQRIQIARGRMVVPAGSEHLADKVKAAYSRQVVFFTAKRNGWQVKETKANVFQVVK